MPFHVLSLSFYTSLYLFHGLNLISTALVILLFGIYQLSKRNRLLRSACLLCLVSSAMLMYNFMHGDEHLFGGPVCQVQAVIFNYVYIALHGHFCFFMVNSCYSALGWTFLGSKSPELRTTLFILTSYLIPILPTAFIVYRFEMDRAPIVHARAFYCSISSPAWPCFRAWFLLFSLPGLYFSFYLLYRTLQYRRTTLHLSKTTQIHWIEIFRLVLAIAMYVLLISLSLAKPSQTAFLLSKFSVPPAENPYLNPEFCQTCDRNSYFCAMLCPNVKTFLPVVVGFMLFAMYGFGSVANKCYRRFFLICSNVSLWMQIHWFGRDVGESDADVVVGSMTFMDALIGSRSGSVSSSQSPYESYPDPSRTNAAYGSNRRISNSSTSTTSASLSAYQLSNRFVGQSRSTARDHHQPHPTLPSIDEDLDVLYMMSSVSNRPSFRRHIHRRFSEPFANRPPPSMLLTEVSINPADQTLSLAPPPTHSMINPDIAQNPSVENITNAHSMPIPAAGLNI